MIHGIGDSSATWQDVIGPLARRHLVIAPDLLGHGASDRPRADYSVAAYANGMRDLLGVLGVDRVTLVGHSLGGGVAMQFAYQFPERTERLVLVASVGLGREVHPVLRLASLPGADTVLSVLLMPGLRWQAQLAGAALRWLGTGIGLDARDLLRLFDALPNAPARSCAPCEPWSRGAKRWPTSSARRVSAVPPEPSCPRSASPDIAACPEQVHCPDRHLGPGYLPGCSRSVACRVSRHR